MGIAVVLATFAVASLLCFLLVDTSQTAPRRAAQDLSDQPLLLGSFQFTERSGNKVDSAQLADEVWIASFLFTRCDASCRTISGILSQLQDRLGESGVRLVSVSVDPEHDTPDVLKQYAKQFGADESRWLFLTAPQDETYAWIRDSFRLPVAASTEEERAGGAEAFAHSDRLALVDRGNKVVGFYSTRDADEVALLLERATKLDKAPPAWAKRLPAVNASLNALSTVLLVLGWLSIRAGKARRHMMLMISALVVSAVFLACYLVYHAQVGSVRYQGGGPLRLVYFSILLSHTVLAAGVVPLILATLYFATRKRFDSHRRIAVVTLPIWLYVSVTGVVVYVLLYHVDGPKLS